MRLITEHQAGTRLGDFLQIGLKSNAISFRGAVAFVRASGMAHLKPLITDFSHTRSFEIIVGVDLKGTTVEGLTMLHDSLSQHGKAFVFYNKNASTFHPKLFSFTYSDRTEIYVGSGNLTKGGLFTNHEAGLHLILGNAESEKSLIKQVHDALDTWSTHGGQCAKPLDQNLIDDMVNRGLVVTEAYARAVMASNQTPSNNNSSNNAAETPLFGSTSVPAAPTPLVPTSSAATTSSKTGASGAASTSTQKTSPSVSKNSAVETFWIETKSMTGGSRNILDLSMRSMVSSGNLSGTPFDIGEPGFMLGTVAFFDVNPTDPNASKDVTLKFEGVDYSGNTILFPTGSNANGTWRLQIKGSSGAGLKITDTFREKGKKYFLVGKIAAFKKIGTNYYEFLALPENQISILQANSKILGYNGSTKNAKRIGFI